LGAWLNSNSEASDLGYTRSKRIRRYDFEKCKLGCEWLSGSADDLSVVDGPRPPRRAAVELGAVVLAEQSHVSLVERPSHVLQATERDGEAPCSARLRLGRVDRFGDVLEICYLCRPLEAALLGAARRPERPIRDGIGDAVRAIFVRGAREDDDGVHEEQEVRFGADKLEERGRFERDDGHVRLVEGPVVVRGDALARPVRVDEGLVRATSEERRQLVGEGAQRRR